MREEAKERDRQMVEEAKEGEHLLRGQGKGASRCVHGHEHLLSMSVHDMFVKNSADIIRALSITFFTNTIRVRP